jgi:hypothetical protein
LTPTRLPHKEPLIFIGKLLEQNATNVTFQTHFPFTPTLAMFCEASAQGTSFFPLSPDCNMGVVSSFRNIKRITPANGVDFDITVSIKHSFGDSYLYEFQAFDNNTITVCGEIAVFYTSI